jgi:excisionase family DNA binding protein
MNDPSSAETEPALRPATADLGRGGTKLAYTVEEAARALGTGRTKVFEAIADGRLRAVKFGRRTLVLVEDAKAFLASLPQAPGGPTRNRHGAGEPPAPPGARRRRRVEHGRWRDDD